MHPDPVFKGAIDFGRGFGDTISWGVTGRIRDGIWGGQGAVKNGGAYLGGELAGVAWGVAAGGVSGARAAGSKAAGLEFSHSIPNRVLKKAGEYLKNRFPDSGLAKTVAGWLKKDFGKSIWNGNFVTPLRHYLHDVFRYPKGWRDFPDRFGPVKAFLDRMPKLLKGLLGGFGWGLGGAAIYDPQSGNPRNGNENYDSPPSC